LYLCVYILCNFRHGALHESCEKEVLKNTGSVNWTVFIKIAWATFLWFDNWIYV